MLENGARVGFLDNFAGVEYRDAVSKVGVNAHVMRDEDDGAALFLLNFLEQLDDATLNDDMSQLIAKVRDGSVIAEPQAPNLLPGFGDFPEPAKTRH